MSKDYYPDDKLKHENLCRIWSVWHLNEWLHRDDGPAFYANIPRYCYRWYKFGCVHRKYQPAIINSFLALDCAINYFSHTKKYMKYEMELSSTGEVYFCRYISDDEYNNYCKNKNMNFILKIYFCKWYVDGKNVTDKVREMTEQGKLNQNYLEWTKREKALFDLKL